MSALYSRSSFICKLFVAAMTGEPFKKLKSSSLQVKVGLTSFTSGKISQYGLKYERSP